MRVVLDTNVLISALFFAGLPGRILGAWIDERFELLASVEILREYRRWCPDRPARIRMTSSSWVGRASP